MPILPTGVEAADSISILNPVSRCVFYYCWTFVTL
jgi:hypothetical protein